jgi:hypothetical protein
MLLKRGCIEKQTVQNFALHKNLCPLTFCYRCCQTYHRIKRSKNLTPTITIGKRVRFDTVNEKNTNRFDTILLVEFLCQSGIM